MFRKRNTLLSMQSPSTNFAAAAFFALAAAIYAFPKASPAEFNQGQDLLSRISPQWTAFHLPVYEPVSLPYVQQPENSPQKRQMRNALVRFGRSGMRNALVRFGKRTPVWNWSEVGNEMKRNDAPQPFVRFGRSGGGAESRAVSAKDNGQRLSTFDHIFDGTDDTMPNF